MSSSEKTLTHIREDGSAAMVDVSEKPVVRREATAEGFIFLQPETISAITDGEVPKGDVLAVARIARNSGHEKNSRLDSALSPIAAYEGCD